MNSIKVQVIAFVLLITFVPFVEARVDDMPENSLTFFVYSPPAPIDWSSPTSMSISAVKNTLLTDKPHAIGHVYIGLKCNGQSPIWTGQTSSGSDLEQALVNYPIVYDLLLTDDWYGVLDSRIEVIHNIELARKHGGHGYFRFLIQQDVCERLTDYFDGYKKLGLHLNYGGLKSDPLTNPAQGAGCAMFGVNFLKVAGLFTEKMQEDWSQTVLMPPEDQPCLNCPTNLQLLLGVQLDWPKIHEPHQVVNFYNPELMYKSLVAITKSLNHEKVNFHPTFDSLNPKYVRIISDVEDINIKGLEIDVRQTSYEPQIGLPNFKNEDLPIEVIQRRSIASTIQEAKKIINDWGPAGHCEELRKAPRGWPYRTSKNANCKKGKEFWTGCDLKEEMNQKTCQMWFERMTD
jgi:hypothetical protein